ncbi:glycosyltransferase family 2 protein [Micromonospora olivasterospora]|uniref:Glycosyl transferase family 2 n=1 Tax=Micromonospora olivasterospora TaxID=1880 RepID=A0A562ID42_MICOL|nr:glycosyl transferase family 2 [Micromonospora olivasterospora]
MDSWIDVVLPCLDEAAALPGVLTGLPPGYRAVVVDNGSTDGSPEVAARHGALVVREPRRGYGAAVHAGLLAARTELVCVLDADGSFDPGVLPRLAASVGEGRADLVAGRRRPVSVTAWPWHARAGNALVAAGLRRRGVPVHDLSPIRVARRAALLELGIVDRAFGYPLELLLRAAAAGWRIVEQDIPYGPRAAGTRSKVSGSVRGTARAIRDMTAVLRAGVSPAPHDADADRDRAAARGGGTP